MKKLTSSRLASPLAIFTLVFTLLVILWGAYVRASGSGAGCGAHWPLCNGNVLPKSPGTKTFVEFFHRATSGLDLILVFLSAWITRSANPKGSLARKAAAASVFFILTEAAVGAGLVLLRLVENDQSTLRAFALAIHLTNTFLLLAALSLQVFWQRSDAKKIPWPDRLGWISLAVTTFVGITGAITALGDTLFPATEAHQSTHFLIRLRIIHPILAILGGTALIAVARKRILQARAGDVTTQTAIALIAGVLIQWAVGFVNVALLAPTALQIIHLLLADSLWILAIRLAFFGKTNALR
ncbi:MAG: COX15/CtaA family protein [Bdellovibrionales bacterium]|nr:COX15/CtaA family protein [Bdellovibrionales bacterium]